MTDTTCQICHRATPPEGRKVCDQCMGFDRTELEQNTEPPTESVLNICNTCGNGFAPYRLGRNTVSKGICFACVMRKKYGPDWVPGGKSRTGEGRSIYMKQLRERKKEARQSGENGNAPKLATPDITISFEGPDKKLFMELVRIATRERRTVDQQVLWFVERTLDLP